MTAPAHRRRFTVTGQVQGVGFRPFVYRVALETGLTGTVCNTPKGVVIEVQGTADALDRFEVEFDRQLPPLARIVRKDREDAAPVDGESCFEIVHSEAGEGHSVLISPDTATCADCMADLSDPENPRHLYPFTNCTNCGPRYTITRSIPYDRPVTSMACFPMCEDCLSEYENPLDRRFHAQPNACPECGPQVWLADRQGQRLAQGDEALRLLARELAAGRIAAVKGLGGFHLMCDACDEAAVTQLRLRKNRPDKPLAVLVPDTDTAALLGEVGEPETRWLAGAERPIVLLRARDSHPLAPSVAPDTQFLGVMQPYTPLHHVLLWHYREAIQRTPGRRVPALVATSGNFSSEPISLGNREALTRLGDIADIFLHHDRDILIRTDDSVIRINPDTGEPIFLRRARGFTPSPVFLPEVEDYAARQWANTHAAGDADRAASGASNALHAEQSAEGSSATGHTETGHGATGHGATGHSATGTTPPPLHDSAPPNDTAPADPCVLGTGPELKCTLCLTKGDQAFPSQHIGDMENLETMGFYEEILAHLQDILQVQPVLAVHDLHPDFMTTRLAQESGLPTAALQHHYAHIHSCLAENRHTGPGIGLALDGTGLGEDGTIWGGECLYVDPTDLTHRRLARFNPFRLPGGEAAVREPWRLAQSLMWELGERDLEGADWRWLEEYGPAAKFLAQVLEKDINCPANSSCGRLFDAVSALLGLCLKTSYEGQAAILLEKAQDMAAQGAYPCPLVWDGKQEEDATATDDDTAGTPSNRARSMPCDGPKYSGQEHSGQEHGGDSPDSRPCQRGPRSSLLDGDSARPSATLDTHTLFTAALADLRAGESVGVIARRFHMGLVQGLADMALAFSRELGCKVVPLSGGVMQNLTIAVELPRALQKRGLTPLVHTQLPPNDACISTGQAAWGRRRLLLER